MTVYHLPPSSRNAESDGDAPSPAARDRDRDRKVTVSLPAPVVRELKARVASEDTTLRALLLEALQLAGYAVAEVEVRDRRRRAP